MQEGGRVWPSVCKREGGCGLVYARERVCKREGGCGLVYARGREGVA